MNSANRGFVFVQLRTSLPSVISALNALQIAQAELELARVRRQGCLD
jgi:hypothetical protein